ncbi:RDH13 dehydrogenase, partial [Polypterus senegalus]|nr:retinol dehydrogenase 11 [Polypterus senegalus]MBN3290928.1 RDH13 dehydrogenase [Polypterus senegalus]
MEWSWTDVLCHPVWVVTSVLLYLVVRKQRRGYWDPRVCPVRLTGKTAIVTGANTGIGKYIALDLARRGARVILACRSKERGQAALEEIKKKSQNNNIHLRIVDTSLMASVREFAQKINEEEKRLDILINNAGASGLPKRITSEGLEVSFATNHVGAYLLTNLLLDLIKRSAPARIVNVSSVNHKQGVVDFSHYRGENLSYSMDTVYNHTKLHNILFTNELARRIQGTGVTANSVHPGFVKTEVMRYYNLLTRMAVSIVAFFFFKSSEEGAVSTIYCAVSEEVDGITGKYFDSDCSLTLASATARDAALAKKDWEFCEKLTGLLETKDK